MEINEILKEALYIDTDITPPPPVITIGGKVIATPGNFITINGLPKSRKTTFAFYVAAAAIAQREMFDISVNITADEKIIYIDTEQSAYDFSRQIKFLKYAIRSQNLPVNFSAYLFRKYEPDQILNSVYTIIKEQRPKILFIDNLTELVINPNDIPESKKVIQFLKRVTGEFNLVIICLLHLGKGNLTTLGNLGSYADRGAQSALKVVFDKDTQTSTLEAYLMRSDSFFNPITIAYDPEQKQYTKTSDPQPKQNSRKFVLMNLTDTDHRNRLAIIFKDSKQITYAELVEEIKKMYGVGTNIAKQQIIPYLVGNSFIKSDKGIYSY